MHGMLQTNAFHVYVFEETTSYLMIVILKTMHITYIIKNPQVFSGTFLNLFGTQ